MLNIVSSKISFKSNDLFKNIPPLDPNYTTEASRAKTVAILGSSKTKDLILDAMDLCSRITAHLVKEGYNILTGCGSDGIMGRAYQAARENSAIEASTGKPKQNLAIVMEPAWGDEDIDHCIPIGKAISEPDRISKFYQSADTFIVFPGSASTIQEAVSLVQRNEYPGNNKLKKIILVGRNFFEGLKQQYDQLAKAELLKHKPEELFTLVNSWQEIISEVVKKSKI